MTVSQVEARRGIHGDKSIADEIQAKDFGDGDIRVKGVLYCHYIFIEKMRTKVGYKKLDVHLFKNIKILKGVEKDKTEIKKVISGDSLDIIAKIEKEVRKICGDN